MTGCAAWSGRTRSSERGVLGETANLEQPHPPGIEHERPVQEAGVSAETPAAGQALAPTSSSLADALLIIAEAFLAGKVAAADDPRGIPGHRACRHRYPHARCSACPSRGRFRGNARLDLDHAIYVCVANAANQARQPDSGLSPAQEDQPEQAGHY
jgi:hypothetical protein